MILCPGLDYLDPTIKPFVGELFSSELFPQHDIEIVGAISGSSHASMYKNESRCDRFKLILPFAGYFITWEVIFDGSCPDIAPDFIFDDDSFLSEYNLDGVPSLVNWPSSKEKSLVCVISDLLKLYTKHQWQNAEKSINPSIGKWFDFDNLLKDDWKVEILNGSQKPAPYLMAGHQRNILQSGNTSVVVAATVDVGEIDGDDLQFTIQYILKSNALGFEENIAYSAELETWVRPYVENHKRRLVYFYETMDSTLSARVHKHVEDISHILTQAVEDFKERQMVQLGVFHSVKANEDTMDITLLEFDFENFKFSSCLYQGKTIFTVDYRSGFVKGQVVEVEPDGTFTKSDVSGDKLKDPSFDILDFLTSPCRSASAASTAPPSPSSTPSTPASPAVAPPSPSAIPVSPASAPPQSPPGAAITPPPAPPTADK